MVQTDETTPESRRSRDDNFGPGDTTVKEATCRSCVHFDDDPASIEAQIPKFTTFGSAYSSARGNAGFCQIHNRFLDPQPARYCPEYSLLVKSR
jgi:hypothetical protein